jgi:adenosylcobinamide-phosphate synthase
LPGLLIYKATNTADSMIGYKTPKYEAFGWAAARFDDVLNWIPARLTALLILLTRMRPDLWPLVRRDARLHRSPNAGWPEAAMAGLLNVALAGPRSYDGDLREFPFVNPKGRKKLTAKDIDASVKVLWHSWFGFMLVVLLFCLL